MVVGSKAAAGTRVVAAAVEHSVAARWDGPGGEGREILAVGSLSIGLLVAWGCWFSLLVYWWHGAVGSLYWSTGGVGLLVLSTGLLVVWGCWFSLLDYWWCGAVGSLYWSIGGVGVTVNWWSRSADFIDSL